MNVAPCVGAGIETLFSICSSIWLRVAPCVGAGIETAHARLCTLGFGSPLAWGRELKLPQVFLFLCLSAVAPCVGAGIETMCRREDS